MNLSLVSVQVRLVSKVRLASLSEVAVELPNLLMNERNVTSDTADPRKTLVAHGTLEVPKFEMETRFVVSKRARMMKAHVATFKVAMETFRRSELFVCEQVVEEISSRVRFEFAMIWKKKIFSLNFRLHENAQLTTEKFLHICMPVEMPLQSLLLAEVFGAVLADVLPNRLGSVVNFPLVALH